MVIPFLTSCEKQLNIAATSSIALSLFAEEIQVFETVNTFQMESLEVSILKEFPVLQISFLLRSSKANKMWRSFDLKVN